MTKIGNGTLSLIGSSAFTGPTNVTAGNLVATAAGLAGPVVLSNNTNVTFNQVVDGTYSSVISGTGSLIKQGGGVLTLSATHSYSGPTLIGAGTLRLNGSPAYPNAGLMGFWPLNSNANDSSGNGYNGTLVNSPTFNSNGSQGGSGCIVFNGSDYVKVDDGQGQTVFNGGNTMTISAWVNGWDNPSNLNTMVSKYGESGQGWQMRQWNSKIAWTTRGIGNGVDDMASNSTTVSQGGWHMVTMTYDGSNEEDLHRRHAGVLGSRHGDHHALQRPLPDVRHEGRERRGLPLGRQHGRRFPL